ncbi:MAG: hemolysin family protein [Acholeplasmatales bacterium]|jgi:putative hemolysin|nr:hemolysin family protein [Acholeplasmatales bacterium]
MVVSIIVIIVVILLNGIFASSEMALVSLNSASIEEDAIKNKRARKVLKFIKKPTRFLSTIQIGITLFGFINGAVGSAAFSSRIIEVFNITNVAVATPIITVVLSLILAFFQVLFGELIPKRIAFAYPKKIAYAFIGFLSFIEALMRPFVLLLTLCANLISKMFGIKKDENNDSISEEEIRILVNKSGDTGEIEKDESKMIDNVFEFNDTCAADVMTHRTKIIAIDIKISKTKLLDLVVKEQYTRYPVYDGNIDHIIGVINVKDLLKYLYDSNEKINLREIMRKPTFVPENTRTNFLLNQMKTSKNHLAIVVDEYGGTAGLITLEDIIEELVGDIFDEYDEIKYDVTKIDDDNFIVNALANIEDIKEALDTELPTDEYDTLSGFILGQIARIPKENEKIIVNYNDFIFEVLEYNGQIIEKVKATRVKTKEVSDD